MKDTALLYGANTDEALVAAELVEHPKGDEIALFFRRGDQTERVSEPFLPFILAGDGGAAGDTTGDATVRDLDGKNPFRRRYEFPTWKACRKGREWLASRDIPHFFINDPVQQHLMASGRTLFKGMRFEALRRMQVDIECLTAEGFDFCNAERESDRIIAIALGDQTGWRQVLSGADMDERAMLERFVSIVRDRDPDVIEGHNIFNFDLPYLAARAKRHRLRLEIGRDGSVPDVRPGRFMAGERTIAYTRFDVFGRHVVDTLLLTHAYDVAHRSLEGHGLKDVARHFGLSAPDRVYIEGNAISAEFRKNPRRVMDYAGHDVAETEALSRILSQSSFSQAQMIPFSYQSICVRGNAAKIDALLVREYLRQGRAVAAPDKARPFAGGYTDLFAEGVIRNVHHVDVRSLYPSLMLCRRLAPRTDELGAFLRLLDELRRFRLEARDKAKQARQPSERAHYDALQAAFKVLINSFYGYLGFDQAHFSDFDAAERVAAEGRALLQHMIAWLRGRGASPIEIDTDGIYFVPPPGSEGSLDRLHREFQAALPEGIEVEFDGVYSAMFSYKMKNYALLAGDGEIVIKGAALKSRGLEPFLRNFLRDLVRAKLEGRDAELPDLRASYETAIRDGTWPVALLAKTETLQDAPSTYAAKIGQKSRGRNAAYELVLKSGRDYQAGDQVSYYVTGVKKSVPVHASARLVSEWNPFARDENVPYYLAKLDALYGKFTSGSLGGRAEDSQEAE